MARLTIIEGGDGAPKLASRAALTAYIEATESAVAIVVAAPVGLRGVNRIYGHDAGDQSLRAFEAAFLRAVPDGGIVARLAGARYAAAFLAGSRDAAQRVLDAATTSAAPGPGARAAGVWSACGAPSAAAAIRMTEERLDAQAPGVATLACAGRAAEDAARLALDAVREGRSHIALQPVVSAEGDGRVLFREALIRAPDGAGGELAAGAFMPALERWGLAEIVDLAALEHGFHALEENPGLRLSVNMSASSVSGALWIDAFEGLARAAPDAAERMIVEVSEDAALSDAVAAAALFDRVRGVGAALALDDFGAGRTSFAHLREFRFDIVKIDGGFVRGVDRSADNQALTSALVDIARRFDMLVVAEYVETVAEARTLRRLGVDGFQGFLFGRPSLIWSDGARVALKA